MPLIKPFKDILPQIAKNVFLAENATIIGDVEIGEGSSIWYQAVLRGDVGKSLLVNAQTFRTGLLYTVQRDLHLLIIGDEVAVGHRAIIHGCTIEDQVLIGMGAIILDEAVIPSHTIIGAGAVVPQKSQLESGFLYAGVPVKRVKTPF
ncbi:MAG: gamma carbonic anhydrase family protein [Bacteroidia bacterium]